MPANPSFMAVLAMWTIEPSVILGVVLTALIYVAGLRELARRRQLREHPRLAVKTPHIVAFAGGLLTITLALLSPVDTLSVRLFSVHMTQHLLLLMIAPPLLLLGKPVPVLLVGVPHEVVRWFSRTFRHTARHSTLLGRIVRSLTQPLGALIFYSLLIVFWHTPLLYQAALRSAGVHLLEHLCFLWAGLFLWWAIIAPWPGPVRRGPGRRLLLVIAAMVPDTVLGTVFVTTDTPFYPFYAAEPQMWGFSVMDDQGLGGVLMLGGGDIIFALTAIPLFFALMDRVEQKELARADSATNDQEGQQLSPADEPVGAPVTSSIQGS